MATHEISGRCPWCGKDNNCAINTVPHETVDPDDGDALLCFECGEWSVIEKGVQRKPTIDEFIDIGKNDDCHKARQAWVKVHQ